MPDTRLHPVEAAVVCALVCLLASCGSETGPSPVAAVRLNPSNQLSAEVGDTIRVQATALAGDGAVIPGVRPSWSAADTTIAAVSSSGLVTARGAGQTEIDASVQGVAGSLPIVVAPAVARVTIAPAEVRLIRGESLQLVATATDPDGSPLPGLPLGWSTSDSGVAAVSGSGLVTGSGVGSVIVSVRAGRKSAQVPVIVVAPVAGVQVTPPLATLFVGEVLQLAAAFNDSAGQPLLGRPVSWTSGDVAVALVDETGLLTALAPGTTSITATVEGHSASVAVTVRKWVAAVEVTAGADSLLLGATLTLAAVPLDDEGAPLADRPLSWSSSDPTVVTVSADGIATAVGEGYASASATAEGKVGALALRVLMPVAAVGVTPADATPVVGDSVQLEAMLRDANGKPLSGRPVLWASSDPSVARVSPAGVVTAVSPGSATIAATAESQQGSATITVRPPVATMKVTGLVTALTVGGQARLTATPRDAAGNFLGDRLITWSSDDPGVASVDATGRVTAAGPGEAEIKATSEGVSDRIDVVVTELEQTTEVFVGAGDIGTCTNDGDEATAQLLDRIAGTVFVAGDNVYDDGTAQEFANCYEPTWGRHKARTRPVPGNHEYNIPGATGYYDYFGAAAGDPAKGYYSFDLGAWHILMLNSNIPARIGSDQLAWIAADLDAHPAQCALAVYHHPVFSVDSGSTRMRDVWNLLYDRGAELVINGHQHNYQRLAPLDRAGQSDPALGVREFIVGTGGKGVGGLKTPPGPPSEVAYKGGLGVLKLTLRPGSYDWEFVSEAGKIFSDSGSASCH
jgi:uncharacterized protein YjdB